MQQAYMNCSLLVEFSPTTCERARYRVILPHYSYCDETQ